MTTAWLKGCLTALVTPFSSGEVDYEALRRHVDLQCREGISGIVVCGSTGESHSLSEKEKLKVLETALAAASGRVPIVMGTGSADTRETIENAKNAKSAGADAQLVCTPYYVRPPQRGMLAHFYQILDATDLPAILYDIPQRTSAALDADTVAALSVHPNFIGVKEASPDIGVMLKLRAICPELPVLSGDDKSVLPYISMGCTGLISVASNLYPRRMQEICTLALSGDFAAARVRYAAIEPFITALNCEVNPITIKYALSLAEIMSPDMRLPLVLPDKKQKELLSAAYEFQKQFD
jgi:4-hydroxy-tetrahydrodipicolinate synthase